MNKKMTLKKKAIIGILIAVIVIIIAVTGFVSNYLVDYAVGRSGDGGNREVALEVDTAASDTEQKIQEGKIREQEHTDAFLEDVDVQDIDEISEDGLNLAADYYENDGSHKWLMVFHGYRGSDLGASVLNTAAHFYEHGYQVLAPDARGCGESEGDYVGMGWLERSDVLLWTKWITDQDPNAQIVMMGASMGAATVMMASGEDTPENVVAFVEDCGYTSVWDVFSSELKLRFGLPEFPILYTASAFCKLKAGYTFGEASAIEQVEKCEKPMMFIHGTLDDFIPFDMLQTLYDAKPGDNKKMLTAEGAGHSESMYVLGDEYWNEVFDFVDRYVTVK